MIKENKLPFAPVDKGVEERKTAERRHTTDKNKPKDLRNIKKDRNYIYWLLVRRCVRGFTGGTHQILARKSIPFIRGGALTKDG